MLPHRGDIKLKKLPYVGALVGSYYSPLVPIDVTKQAYQLMLPSKHTTSQHTKHYLKSGDPLTPHCITPQDNLWMKQELILVTIQG